MLNINRPCVRKCSLNEEDICLGCFRTFNDMLVWNKASEKEKEEMLKKAQQREKQYHEK